METDLWSDGEFSKDPAYSLIPALFASLRREGMDFSSEEERVKKRKVPSDPMAVSSQQEEEDIAKAIQLSLQETKGKRCKRDFWEWKFYIETWIEDHHQSN